MNTATMTKRDRLRSMMNSDKPILVEFMRPGSDRTAEDERVIAELKSHFGTTAHIMTVDGAADADLRHEYKIESYPTFVLIKDGAVAWRDSGRKSFGELANMIADFI